MQFKGLGVPNKCFATQNEQMYTLESIFSHTAHDLFRQVSRVIFGVSFQHRFQNDALRTSRNDFRCRYQFHAVPLQLGLVPGTVVAVPGKAVEFPDNMVL